jgi:ring-1,2-phenylacetyl-CoA epoxidase subunit PaaD
MAMRTTHRPSIKQVWAWLEEVPDPEIPVLSVVDLGIVRELSWAESGGQQKLLITVTPTYSGCPATAVIREDIRAALFARGIQPVEIRTRLSPPWTTAWLSAKGREKLQNFGIAPPVEVGGGRRSPGVRTGCELQSLLLEEEMAVPCPRCGSPDTALVSRFGSTPCKAMYRCNICREPFDYFKCH